MKTLQENLQLGVSYHQIGNLAQAEQTYNEILSLEPNNEDALHLLGVIAYQNEKYPQAYELILKAIKSNPNKRKFYNNLGNVLQSLGNLEEAVAAYANALILQPEYPEAYNNLGNALFNLDKLEDAIAAYEEALALNPNYPEAYNNLGNALYNQKNIDAAITAYNQALKLNPNYPEAHKNIGNVLLNLGKLDDAIENYERAIALKSNYYEAENNLGICFLGKEWYDKAQAIFHKIFWSKYGISDSKRNYFNSLIDESVEANDLYASPFKLRDRIDQLSHLISSGKIDTSFQELVVRYQLFAQELDTIVDRTPYTPLTKHQAEQFALYYDKVIYYKDAPCLQRISINEGLDYQAIEEQYLKASMVYFDDLLTQEALANLHQFCLESTIFFRHSEAGFVGSYMTEGFNCSLIYQFITELKQRLPRVLHGLPLNNMWIYRYGSKGSGVKTHTGDGSVTLNFWITPTFANLDSEGKGGLVMYDKEQPFDWDWLTFNTYKDDPAIQERINEYLADSKSLTIPYRCNRAVLFHSNLFHRSDPFHFRDNFQDRRMNITMLFGQRGKESAPLK